MGFAKAPKITTTAAPPTTTVPPVVSETVQEDATRSYDQQRSSKRGLLSTILSTRSSGSSLSPQAPGNTTLG